MLGPRTARARSRLHGVAALLAACTLAFACEPDTDDDAGRADASAGWSVLERTVRIGVLRVAERTLEREADGSVSYPDAIPLGGVSVCVAQRRDAYAILQPFEPLESPICKTNMPDKTMYLDGVPANSDLILTYIKAGYQLTTTTFRTDEHDVAVPRWADNMAYFVPLVRAEAVEPWLEPEPEGDDARGTLAVWVLVTGDWGLGEKGKAFGSEGDPGVAQSEGVRAEIFDAAGEPMAELVARRDRPLFVRVPEGEYSLRFVHDRMEVVPFGVQEQFMITGLPTDAYDTIEVPVLADRLALASMETYCPLPTDARMFEDLATCTLEPAAPDGTP